MKNLYLLPTEKSSRLIWYTTGKYHLLKEPIFIDAPLKPSRHIYITSDEEIKDGDFYIYIKDGSLRHYKKEFNPSAASASYNKKIILTTDHDLIKDGVQEITDEFLEWFVKNPSCEKVKLEHIGYVDAYKIIIPKEEDFKLVSIGEETIKLAIPMIQDKEEHKQETVEEAAERLYPTTINSFTDSGFDMSETERLIFINGAKWQQEQDKKLYSEEEVLRIITECKSYLSFGDEFDEIKWFEQFKKK